MEKVAYSDSVGSAMRSMFLYKGCPVPDYSPYQEHILNNTAAIQAKKTDIFICGYPRSGNHWLWELVYMLTNNMDELSDPDMFNQNIVEVTAMSGSPTESARIGVTHLPVHLLPHDILEKRCRLLCTMRNPKDILVSTYNFITNFNVIDYSGSWDNFIQMFLQGEVPYGSWFQHVLGWQTFMENQADYPISLFFFEDFKKDILTSLRRLAHVLGVACDEELLQSIAQKTQFHNMSVSKQNGFNEQQLSVFKDSKDQIYRKGLVGEWKSWFTVSQSEQFDKVYNERMKKFKWAFSYTV